MKELDEILTQLQSDLSADLPALLTAESLSNFDEYEIGPARDADKVGLYIYFDNGNFDVELNSISVIFQLQLTEIADLAAAKYAKVVKNYLKAYNPADIGMVFQTNISYDNWPIEQTQGSFVYIICDWQEPLDSCDD